MTKHPSEQVWQRILERPTERDGDVELRASTRPVDPAFESGTGARAHSEPGGAYARILPAWGPSRLMAMIKEKADASGPGRILAYAMITPPWTSGASCGDPDPTLPAIGLVGCWTHPNERGKGLAGRCVETLLRRVAEDAVLVAPETKWRVACERTVIKLVSSRSPFETIERIDPLSLVRRDDAKFEQR